MAFTPRAPLVIALLGPTASGKTDLGIALAQALDLAVLSVDSRQLYRRMDIGTAKPTPEQQRQARHELLDLRDPDDPITLQAFRRLALEAIATEHQRRGIALLVGGSGLYLQALTQGLEPPAVPPQPALRQQLSDLGQPQCRALLTLVDPQAAARIMPRDAVRTLRALEVFYGTGTPLSSLQSRTAPPWTVLELGLNPADLQRRIALRTRHIYEQGLVEETASLIADYGESCPLLDTIGYGEARQLLNGTLDSAAAIALTTQRTRQFAKRQRTWFRRQHQPIWLDGAQSPLQEALQRIEQVLG